MAQSSRGDDGEDQRGLDRGLLVPSVMCAGVDEADHRVQAIHEAVGAKDLRWITGYTSILEGDPGTLIGWSEGR